MIKKAFKFALSMLVMMTTIFSAPITNLFAAEENSFIVDDTETNKDSENYFTYSAQVDQNGRTGWAADTNAKVENGASYEARTQHWVWNTDSTEARKHTYTFTFKGTGVKLYGTKSDEYNTFQLDNEASVKTRINGQANKLTVLYERKDLAYGEHKVTVTMPEDENGKGLQVAFAEVFGSKLMEDVILPNQTEGSINYFKYHAYEGKQWTIGENEAYIDLGANDPKAEETYYEIPFVGNRISIRTVKAPTHGKVKFTIDGEHEKEVDLYNAKGRIEEVVYDISGLEEGSHTLKAVTLTTKSGSSIVNQVVNAKVYHAPYVLKDIEVDSSMTLIQEETRQISIKKVPDYANVQNLKFTSNDLNVVSVDNTGKVSALKEGKAKITISATGITDKVVDITVLPQTKKLAGSIVDENLQYTQDTYDKVKGLNQMDETISVWQNDVAVSEIAIIAKDSSLKDVSFEVSDFTNEYGTIPASNVDATFVKSVQAYTGMPGWGYAPNRYPQGDRAESSDVLYTKNPVDIPFGGVQPIWVNINVPKDTIPGIYTGEIKVRSKSTDEVLTFVYNLNVQNVALPDASEFANGFDIELWQYPYSSAEYYNVEPFSKQHLDILKSIMEKYKSIGGHAITTTINEDAWDRQTYSKNEIHYPSMVKWIQQDDDTFKYDFTHFDKWVQFNKDLGIGDKIVIYSIAPWHNSFTYWRNGKLVKEQFTVGNERYTEVWTDFFRAMVKHLDEKGWFDDAYVGIDERGLTETALNLVDSIKNKDGKKLKTAGAMDNLTGGDHPQLARRIDDLNVGDTVVQKNPEVFQKLLKDRNALGLKTTLYSCTGHIPGNFSLSAPAENYWSILFAYKNGTTGFLRWAYDAWVEDPLRDTSHSSFEAGDCFLIFPDERNAANPNAKSSIRLEKMAQGVRDVNKLIMMTNEIPELKADVDALLSSFDAVYESRKYYLTENGKNEIVKDMNAVHEGIAKITDKYLSLKGKSVDRTKLVKTMNGARSFLSQAEMYTAESFALFKSAYMEAERIVKDINSTQADLEAAITVLMNALNGLVKVEITPSTPDKNPSIKPDQDSNETPNQIPGVDSNNKPSNSIETGDSTNLVFTLILLGVSVIGLCLLFMKKCLKD